MSIPNAASAIFGDLLLTIAQNEETETWSARVEEVDDPNSALSDGTEYASSDRAKGAAITIALDLFGTNVPAIELKWLWREGDALTR